MRNKSVVWMPVLFVGAMIYWTLAFGFGGLSLRALTQFEYGLTGTDWSDKDSYQSITVNLSDLPDPGETQGQETGAVRVDLVAEPDPSAGAASGQGARGGAVDRQGPGDTAF